ncbi:hypothetical protein BDN70DRAFT_932007 [Pholiota conissans]|uniref:Uncharacterized protein n=1 Tax=Pholiota conissans TaxID=109636 RepID=A0A9P6CUZ5_9AGAR|nr:hypothetical protein BDN70DRAFT_932007 [Pholiota conissans]
MASRGLPANPRPRTKSAPAPSPTSSRPPAQRRALPANPRSRPPQPSQRERVPDPIPSPVSRWNRPSPNVNPARRNVEHSPTSSVSSGSSDSSSSSSRSWGTSSSASSRTTLQSDDDIRTKYANNKYDAYRKESGDDNSYSSSGVKDAVEFGWGKVSEVANVFTLEVSKVWASGLNPLYASDNPQDDESDLTRVMRAYHLSKAKHPSELPNWLFSERERGQLGSLLRSEVHGDDSQAPRQRNQSDSGATRNPEPHFKNVQNFPTPVNRLPPSGTDRLKMLRERRSAPSNRV